MSLWGLLRDGNKYRIFYVAIPRDVVIRVIGPYAFIGRVSEGYTNFRLINDSVVKLLKLVDGKVM